MTGVDLSIVIPAFKEARKITADVAAADNFLTKAGLSGEIILVDDGSPDDTAKVARSLQAEYPRLQVISYEQNQGKGYAIVQGIERATGRFVMFADAGLCVPFEIAQIGLTMLELGMCDVAMGSRRMRGSVKKAQPLYRRIGAIGYSVLIHLFMGIPAYISDTQCGFKLYRRDVAKHLWSELQSTGWYFDVEIILRGLREGYRILEFPVLWTNDPDTRFNPLKHAGRIFTDLAKIRWNLWREGPRRHDSSVAEPNRRVAAG